jgi:hypothetical protein
MSVWMSQTTWIGARIRIAAWATTGASRLTMFSS